jgi:hypothetical protein
MEDEIAKVLNLNKEDSGKIGDLINEYLSETWESNVESSDSENEDNRSDSEDEFDPTVSDYDSVLKNEACTESADATVENFDEKEHEIVTKFR